MTATTPNNPRVQDWFDIIDEPRPTTPVCLSIKRHRDRMTAIAQRPDVVFDKEKADRVVRFIENNLNLTGDWSGQPFKLMAWQIIDLIYPIYGLVYRASGLRVIRAVYAQLPRGSGKTQFNAGLILFALVAMGAGLKLYCVGSTRGTARGVFDDCCDIYFASPKLHEFVTFKGIEFPTELYTTARPRNTLQVISSDNRFDGPRPAFVSFDEFHRASASSELHTIFEQSITKLREGLMITITNAGDDLNTPCYGEYQRACRILAGELNDDTFLAYVPEPDPGDAWDDIETAKKVNLSLGHTVRESDLAKELDQAKTIPSKKPKYLRYRLNQWVIGAGAAWMPYERFEAVTRPFDVAPLEGGDIFLGVDKASKTDLSSIGGIVWHDGRAYAMTWNYRPDSKIENITGEAPYKDWLAQGFLHSGGHDDIVRDSVLMDRILDISRRFNIKGIGFDRAHAGDLMADLDDLEFPVFEIPQSKLVFTEPINKHEELILTGAIVYPADPCLAWQLSNALVEVDKNDLKRFVKAHRSSNKRNDAVVALTQAIYMWLKMERAEDEPDEKYTDPTEYYSGLEALTHSATKGGLV